MNARIPSTLLRAQLYKRWVYAWHVLYVNSVLWGSSENIIPSSTMYHIARFTQPSSGPINSNSKRETLGPARGRLKWIGKKSAECVIYIHICAVLRWVVCIVYIKQKSGCLVATFCIGAMIAPG